MSTFSFLLLKSRLGDICSLFLLAPFASLKKIAPTHLVGFVDSYCCHDTNQQRTADSPPPARFKYVYVSLGFCRYGDRFSLVF